MAWQNIDKKYLMCQIPIKMLKQQAIPNLSLQNLKIYSSKGCRNEFLAEGITSGYGLLLQLVNTFTIDTEEYYPRCYNVNDAKAFKILITIILRFVLTNHMYNGLLQKKSKQGAWGYTFLTPISLPFTPLASLEFLDLSLYP